MCIGHESRKEVNNRRKGCNGGKQKMIELCGMKTKGETICGKQGDGKRKRG